MRESQEHIILKERAKEFLFSKGCSIVKEEVPFLKRHLIIDLVGYRGNKPVVGIECGHREHEKDVWKYNCLPFPVYHFPYPDLGNDIIWKSSEKCKKILFNISKKEVKP